MAQQAKINFNAPPPLAGAAEQTLAHSRETVSQRALGSLLASKVAMISFFVLFVLIVLALFAPWIAPYPPDEMNLINRRLHPAFSNVGRTDPAFLLGTDGLGRDVLSRLVYGARMTLIVAFASVVLGGFIGVFAGLVAGYFGKWLDAIIMRLADLQLAFPSLLLGLVAMALLGSGVVELVIVIALTQWAVYARVVRSEVIKVKQLEFVQGARALGAGKWRIIFRHVLPNTVASLLVVASFSLALAIYYEAALSFFGLGVPPAIPTWGNMLADARDIIFRDFYAPLWPGIAITVTVLAFNLIGDWVRDFFDVRI